MTFPETEREEIMAEQTEIERLAALLVQKDEEILLLQRELRAAKQQEVQMAMLHRGTRHRSVEGARGFEALLQSGEV